MGKNVPETLLNTWVGQPIIDVLECALLDNAKKLSEAVLLFLRANSNGCCVSWFMISYCICCSGLKCCQGLAPAFQRNSMSSGCIFTS